MATEDKVTPETPAGYRWTWHPLVDAGIAALVAFAAREKPEELTHGDLEEFAGFAERSYLEGYLRANLDNLFFNFLNRNPKFTPADWKLSVGTAVTAYRRLADEPSEACVYCGEQALSNLDRQNVPMILARGAINFYPRGRPGLHICGRCQTALHGLVVGAPRCSGKTLVVHAADLAVTVGLTARWVPEALRYAQLGEATATASHPRTRLVERLLEAWRLSTDRPLRAIVAYHIRSAGQGPGIEVYTLPSNVVGFLKKARLARTRAAWMAIERRGWQLAGRQGSFADIPVEERVAYRNYVYEDLFTLPENAGSFFRRYLRGPSPLRKSSGSEKDAGASAEAGTASAVTWDLVSLFLQEVMGMERDRINAIRELGDRLAYEAQRHRNPRRFLGELYRLGERRRDEYAVIRATLLRIDKARIERGEEPILTMDGFLRIFEQASEFERADRRLAWDLVLFRLLETLGPSVRGMNHGTDEIDGEAEEAEVEETEDDDILDPGNMEED